MGEQLGVYSLQSHGEVAVVSSCSLERSKNYLQGPGISWGISEVGRCTGEWGEEKLCSSQTGGGERNRWEGEAKEGWEAAHIHQ